MRRARRLRTAVTRAIAPVVRAKRLDERDASSDLRYPQPRRHLSKHRRFGARFPLREVRGVFDIVIDMTPSRLPADLRRSFQEAVDLDSGRSLSIDEAEEAAMRVLRVVKLVATILAEREDALTTIGNKRDSMNT